LSGGTSPSGRPLSSKALLLLVIDAHHDSAAYAGAITDALSDAHDFRIKGIFHASIPPHSGDAAGAECNIYSILVLTKDTSMQRRALVQQNGQAEPQLPHFSAGTHHVCIEKKILILCLHT